MSAEPQRTCPSCGNEFSGAMEFCPVCVLRKALGDADHERTSALRRDLDQLSSDAGAKLLRALGVKGDEAELRSASVEFSGHCLALTLLGSYLTDAYHGDIDVEEFREMRLRRARHDVLDDEDPAIRFRALADRLQDPRAFAVVPIVEDHLKL